MNRSYFSSTIDNFIATHENEILGTLTSSENIFSITPKTTYAWQGEISVIKSSLEGIGGYIHFEYIIPRMGKRVDILLVIKNIIFLIEFKVGSDAYDASSIDQLVDYTLYLKNFHDGSHHQIICPILIATEAQETNFTITIKRDDILEPIFSNGQNLNEIIEHVLESTSNKTPDINHDEWELYKFVGTKFQKRSQEHQRKYLLNAYRVLLTRARQGLIIFVPRGDNRDKTRDPKFYDGTYEYLINCGFDEL